MKVTEHFAASNVPVRVGLYAAPKTGKTRLSTALPWDTPRWGSRAIYVPTDPGAEELGSVLSENRERLICVKPEPKTLGGKVVYDPLAEAVEIATHDWQKDFPDVRTLIWDTMTQTSRELLSAYADSGQFSDKHVTFGKPGSATYHAQPMEGDYGAAQRSTLFILQYLFRQPLNLVVLFHEDHVEPKEDKPAESLYGGPSIAGKAGIKVIAALFDNLFRLDVKNVPGKGGVGTIAQYRVNTVQRYIWLAGFRHMTRENPIPTVILEPNPVHFWNSFDEVTSAPQTQENR